MRCGLTTVLGGGSIPPSPEGCGDNLRPPEGTKIDCCGSKLANVVLREMVAPLIGIELTKLLGRSEVKDIKLEIYLNETLLEKCKCT